jgi:hypothetical protein
MRQSNPVGKHLDFSGNQQPGADRKLRQPGRMKQHNLTKPAVIADDHPMRLVFLRRRLIPDNLDPQGGDAAGPCLTDFYRLPAVDEIDGQVKQHVAHRVAANQSAQQHDKPRPNAGQGCEGRT